MKGIIARTMAGTCGLALLGASLGCHGFYLPLYDPCYPERYEYMARQEVNAGFLPQAANGHALEQTIWNYYFEAGTEKLMPGGQDYLKTLARRRPQPDQMIYLQTAQDVAYDPAAPEKYALTRANLDAKRIAEIQKFLSAETAGRGQNFQVMVHDPNEVGISAERMLPQIRRLTAAGTGILAGGGGAGGAGAATGGAPPSR